MPTRYEMKIAIMREITQQKEELVYWEQEKKDRNPYRHIFDRNDMVIRGPSPYIEEMEEIDQRINEIKGTIVELEWQLHSFD